jgi:hypothetical protein
MIDETVTHLMILFGLALLVGFPITMWANNRPPKNDWPDARPIQQPTQETQWLQALCDEVTHEQ